VVLWKDCAAFVHTILETLSLSLGLPPSINLPSTHARSLFQLRLLHYPSIPLRTLLNNEKTRISAHSDFGTLTLLFQDQVGGLEVEILEDDGKGTRRGSGLFRAVPYVEGAVLVNVGDLLMRWSNDRWKSTVHRVGAPPASLPSHENGVDENAICPPRYSIPFFATVDPDTVIECLPGCWGPGNPKRYESVMGGEYFQMRMAPLY
jgi:isopenicillin N synthase-like dioxygenase